VASIAPTIQAASSSPAAASAPRQLYPSVEQKAAGSTFRILPSLLFLLVGALLGAAGSYYLKQSAPEPVQVAPPPPITEMKSNNTALTAFEESRRQVDTDPAKYLNANAASPQDAEDYYLLGRAFLLTGKYWEAKRSFNEAKNRMQQVQPDNQKTLAAEIAMAMAIIESPSATESFTKNAVTSNTATIMNTGTAEPSR